MSRLRIMTLAMVVAFANLALLPSEAQAGPLLDWLRGVCRQRTTARTTAFANPQASACNTCNTGNTGVAAPNSSQYVGAHNPAGLQPGQCMRTCNQTCSRTVVNYVPYTAYRTNWKRVPNTQYRPVTNSDPCTGCTVTCMRPCTTYSWQMQRTPYTTYRPVYRQENYTVPVTTITNDCATGTCATGTCNTCTTPSMVQQSAPAPSYAAPGTTVNGSFITPDTPAPSALPTPASQAPMDVIQPGDAAYYGTPSGTLNTGMNYGTQPASFGSGMRTAPANSAPAINSFPTDVNPQNYQRPVTTQFAPYPTGNNLPRRQQPSQDNRRADSNVYPIRELPRPRMLNLNDKTAQSPVRRQWSYSPVRLASHTVEIKSLPTTSREYHVTPRVQKSNPAKKRLNPGWESVDW